MRPCLSLEVVTCPSISPAPTTRFLLPFSSRDHRPSPRSLISASRKYLSSESRPFSPCCSSTDESISLHEKAADGEEDEELDDSYREPDTLSDGAEESVSGDGVFIEISKTGKNSRRIVARIGIDATLDTIWGILTDYERLADFIPGLAVSELMEKRENFARLYQVGEQNLAFGLKFNAKGVVDCYEKDLESLPNGQKRDIEFKMVEGDFQVFEGTWSIEQLHGEGHEEFLSTLTYVVDVKPKLWLPVQLVEGRLCKEITSNLSSIRKEASKAAALPASPINPAMQ